MIVFTGAQIIIPEFIETNTISWEIDVSPSILRFNVSVSSFNRSRDNTLVQDNIQNIKQDTC